MPTPRGEPEGPATRPGGGLWGGLWQRLARPPAAAAEDAASHSAYSRETLQTMIERKRQNDALRHQEFDGLRKLRRRASPDAPAAAPHPLFHSSIPSSADERATTLKKIDEIEAQMSIQWRRIKTRASARTTVSRPTRALADGAADTAHAPTQANPARTVVPVAAAVRGLAAASAPITPFVHDPEFEDAALRFARGDVAGAQASLLALLAPDHPRASQPETWQVLFDLYRVTDQQAAYDERATEFAWRFQSSPPQWRRLFEPDARGQAGTPARAEGAVSASRPASEGETPAIDWSCPPVLDLTGVRALQQTLTRLPQPWRLSWADLARLEPEALPALTQLVAQWAGQRVRLRMVGIEALERILDSRTACGDRSADPRWWALRLDWLRAMRRGDEFELVALDYCVTYEVSPPAWDPPLCEVRLIAGAGETRADTGFEAFESRVSTLSLGDVADLSGFGASAYALPVMGELRGALLGDIADELTRLETRLQGVDVLIISCSRLERLDFEAAGALLNWVAARQAESRAVHLIDVHRLVAAFLGAMGLASQACITLRRD